MQIFFYTISETPIKNLYCFLNIVIDITPLHKIFPFTKTSNEKYFKVNLLIQILLFSKFFFCCI